MPLTPVAEIRNSAEDDAFVHFIVELHVYICTHKCVLCLNYFAYTRVFTACLEMRFLYFPFFFLHAVCLFDFFFTILLTLPCRRVSKNCCSDSNRPSTLGKKQLKQKSRSQAWSIRFIKILLRNEMLFHLICIKNQYGVQFILRLPFLCCETKMSEISL